MNRSIAADGWLFRFLYRLSEFFDSLDVFRLHICDDAVRVKHEAIPQWAEGLYYNKGLFSEALVYYDDEALYFEVRGQDSGVVRFSYEMLETLKVVVEEE